MTNLNCKHFYSSEFGSIKLPLNFHSFQESSIHRALFWVAISVLQLDDVTLYAAGLALLEQNLHTLSSQGVFDKNVSYFSTKTRFEIYSNDFCFIVEHKRCHDGNTRTP